MKTETNSAFFWSDILILFISSIIFDDCDVDEKNDSKITSIKKKSSEMIETNQLNVIVCSKRLTAMRKTFLSMTHFVNHNRIIDFAEWLRTLSVDFAKLTRISNQLIIEITKTFIWFEIKSPYLWSVLKNSWIW